MLHPGKEARSLLNMCLLEVQLAEANQAKDEAEQEAAYLQQDLDDANAAHDEAVRSSEEQQQAREEAEQACTDLQQDLDDANAAHEEAAHLWQEERQAREGAETQIASLQQQLLERATVVEETEVASPQLKTAPVPLHGTTLMQVCLYSRSQAGALKEWLAAAIVVDSGVTALVGVNGSHRCGGV